MSSRPSEIVLLCEDDAHERLVREFLRICDLPTSEPKLRIRNASREVAGGNVGYVMAHFAGELKACRARNTKACTFLIVVVDADELTTAERRQQLCSFVRFCPEEPVAVLIPRRHIETWICFGNGRNVNEVMNCKGILDLDRSHFRRAAKAIHEQMNQDSGTLQTCPSSFSESLVAWRRIAAGK